MAEPVLIQGLVEGQVDEEILRRLAAEAGLTVQAVHGKKGKAHLLSRLKKCNEAAAFSRWVVLVDLDQDADCAPPFLAEHLVQPSAGMTFRLAVREVEAWLLADSQALAEFLEVSTARIPGDPEAQPDPKQAMVNLARRSRSPDIKKDMVPKGGSGRSEGNAYVSRLIDFVREHCRPERAARKADSLDRCLRRLRELAEGAS